jgi:hypothetical protein
MILKAAFEDQDHIAIAERKLEVLKQTNCDFSTCYAEL